MADAAPGAELVLEALKLPRPAEAARSEIQQLASLADTGRVAEAAARAGAILHEGSTDVRVLVACLRGAFWQRGPAALADVLNAVRCLLGPGWDVVAPVSSREAAVDGALRSMLRHVVACWDFDASTKGDKPWKWPLPEAAALRAALETSGALRRAAEARIPAARFTELLSELDARLRVALDAAAARARAEASLAAAPTAEPAPPPRDEPPREPAPTPREPAPTPRVHREPDPTTSTAGFADAPSADEHSQDERDAGHALEVSHAMRALIRKLSAFEVLVARGEELRAAIVASDLQDLFASFDPREYFPQLLAPHFALRVHHRASLLPYMAEKGNPEWRELEQLYRVDLDAFVGA